MPLKKPYATQTSLSDEEVPNNRTKRTSSKYSRNNIVERLPSISIPKETMSYFRAKILQYEAEQVKFKKKLEKYMRIVDDRHMLESEMLKRRDKITALQQGLSQLKDCAFKERDRCNILQNEVNMLKIRESEYHMKIQQLLRMTKDKKLQDDIVYIFNEPLGIHIRQRLLSTRRTENDQTRVKQIAEEDSIDEQIEFDTLEVLKRQNDMIQKMIDDHSEMTDQKVEAMVKDCSVTMQEAQLLSNQDREKIQHLTQKLKEAEDELQFVNTELLDVRKNLHREEIVREMQKQILLKNIGDVINSVSGNDKVANIITKMSMFIDRSSELFESAENHEPVGISRKDSPPTRHHTYNPSNNAIEVDVYPSKVHVESRSQSLENVHNNKDNNHFENVNSQHAHSSDKIHCGPGGDHLPSHNDENQPSTRHVSFSALNPKYDKENFPHRSVSAPQTTSSILNRTTRLGSCLKTTSLLLENNSNITVGPREKTPSIRSHRPLVRPKTADPRRRTAAGDEVVLPESVIRGKSSVVGRMGKGSTGLLSDDPSKTIGDKCRSSHLKHSTSAVSDRTTSVFAPSTSQSDKFIWKPRSGKRIESPSCPTILYSDKTTQCELGGNFLNQGDTVERTIPRTHGLFLHQVPPNLPESSQLSYSKTQISEDSDSSLDVGNGLRTRLGNAYYQHSSYDEDLNITSHKHCNGRINDLKERVKSLNYELQEIHARFCQDQCLLQEYEQQCAELQRELRCQRNQQEAVTTEYEERNQYLAEQLKATKMSLQKMESYRRLQIEGFQTDIKMLTKQVREIQKTLNKSELLFDQSGRDIEYLKMAHSTAQNSLHVSNELLRLKAKLYQIESNLNSV